MSFEDRKVYLKRILPNTVQQKFILTTEEAKFPAKSRKGLALCVFLRNCVVKFLSLLLLQAIKIAFNAKIT